MSIRSYILGLVALAVAMLLAFNLHPTPPSESVTTIESVVKPAAIAASAPPTTVNTAKVSVEPEDELARLERDVQDLKHEIDRGEYVRRINDPSGNPEIQRELRARIRLYARKTLEFTRAMDRKEAL